MQTTEDLIKKYLFAGRIRLISFSLLLAFLLLMKLAGGYSYLNTAFLSLILVEAFLNQPYRFIIRRVDIHRFQYYQMAVDIIAVSWILYYMGGLEAPLVSIGYYAVILWAGTVSSAGAVFFAAAASSFFFSSIVLLEYKGLLPSMSFYDYTMPPAQQASLLLGNVSFFFAFGYFSARSSVVIRYLERKRQEASLRYMHRFLQAGYLVGSTAHDALNCLGNINGYIKILLGNKDKEKETGELLRSIEGLGVKGAALLSRLGRFSRSPVDELAPTEINKVIDDSLELTHPLVRYSKMAVEKRLGYDIPRIMANSDHLQEAFVALILNALDAVSDEGRLTITTGHCREMDIVTAAFSDTGPGMSEADLKSLQAAEPLFIADETKTRLGIGLAAAYEIIKRHKGAIELESAPGKGTTFAVRLPAAHPYSTK